MKNKTHDEPQFDEHANEDSYFGVKEHELIEDLRSEHRKNERAQRAAQMAICPKCLGKLAQYRFIKFDLERCENCEGIWLNKGELENILRQQARGWLGAFLDRCFSKTNE